MDLIYYSFINVDRHVLGDGRVYACMDIIFDVGCVFRTKGNVARYRKQPLEGTRRYSACYSGWSSRDLEELRTRMVRRHFWDPDRRLIADKSSIPCCKSPSSDERQCSLPYSPAGSPCAILGGSRCGQPYRCR